MKEKKYNILVILLIFIIIGLVGYIVYNNVVKTAEKQNDKVEQNTSQQHKTGNLYSNENSKDTICSTTSNNPYVKGTMYTCDNLGDGKSYTFYVLNDANDSKKIDLIMNMDYAKSSYITSSDFTETNNTSIGPINAIKSLPTTSTWSNLETPKDDSGYDYNGYAARLPMAKELASACGISDFNTKDNKIYELKNISNCSFLWENTQYVDNKYDYSGYYTSTPLDHYLVWSLYSTNMTKEEYDDHVGTYSEIQLYDTVLLSTISNVELGIRPVISLYK